MKSLRKRKEEKAKKRNYKILSESEKEKRENKLQEILKRNKEERAINNNNKTYTKIEKEKKINQTLEDMSIMGTIMKDKILEEKATNPEKFVPIQEAVKTENKDNSLFVMGLLAQNLEEQGITTAIEKENSDLGDDNKDESSSTVLQFMVNGMTTQKKFDLHFDLGNERNEELLNNEDEQKKFNDKLRKKLAKEYNMEEDDIIISFPQKGSYQITVIFKNKEFLTMDKKDLLEKFQDEPELGKLKDLHTNLIMNGCSIKPSMFDSRGNNKDGGWGENETRGGEPYIPPIGWIRYGLKVLDKYDKGNNDWLAYDNRKGEWCVAYHGVGQGQESDSVKKMVGSIAASNLRPGSGQCYKDDDDCRHPGQKVGVGVYCTPDPNVTVKDDYAGIVNVNGEQYYMAFMLRVHPDKIRCSADKKDYWVLNGTDDEIRPYGILVKKV